MCQHGWLPKDVLNMTVTEFLFALDATSNWNREQQKTGE